MQVAGSLHAVSDGRRLRRRTPPTAEHPPQMSSRRLVQKDVEEGVGDAAARHQPPDADNIPRRDGEQRIRQQTGNVDEDVDETDDEKTSGRLDARRPAALRMLSSVAGDDGGTGQTVVDADGSMVLVDDEKDLRVRDDHDDGRRDEDDARLEQSKDDGRPLRDDDDRKLRDGVECPVDASQVGAKYHDEAGRPDGGDEQIPPTIRQYRRVGERTDDYVTLERRHQAEAVDGDEEEPVYETAVDDKQCWRQRH